MVVDLASLEGSEVEIKSLQMEDQIVWDILQACSLDSVDMAVTARTFVFVI